MTKEITKAFILQQIEDKFKLRELTPEKFAFSEMVIPTYNIEPHLSVWEAKNSLVSITSAPTTYLFFTVPGNERWTLRGYYLVFYSEGAYKVSGVNVAYRPGAGDNIFLDLKKEQMTSYIVNLPVPVVLDSGNTLSAYVDTYVSTANLKLVIDVKVEELR